MPLPKCQFCKRKLTNAESVNQGIGPECRERRTKFFGAAGTSEIEVSRLVSLGDETVARWVNLFGKATANKDLRYAKIYIEAARREAEALMPVAA